MFARGTPFFASVVQIRKIKIMIKRFNGVGGLDRHKSEREDFVINDWRGALRGKN